MSAPDRLDFVTLDVFTEDRYKGNPLAIVHVPRSLEVDQVRKQAIAREFNLSETVFLHDGEDDSPNRKIDIFLPALEVPFAGHPTIGTIYYICTDKAQRSSVGERLTIHTKAGPIAAFFDHETRFATASIPHQLNIHRSSVHWKCIADAQPPLIESLTADGHQSLEAWALREDGSDSTFPIVSIVNGMNFVLVDFPQVENYLGKVQAGYPSIEPSAMKLDEGWSSSVLAPYYYVTLPAQADQVTRLRTRLIHATIGEDPATGSAAAALSSYLALQQGGSNHTYTYKIDQGVEMGRHSEIGVMVILDESGTCLKEVLLSGTAARVMQGTLIA
jgi:PhzF family phenazine biosynthesis protein